MSRTLQSLIDQWEGDQSLYEADSLPLRTEVLDRLEDALTDASDEPTDQVLLTRARTMCSRMDAVNHGIYQHIREDIRQGRGHASLLKWLPAPLFDDEAKPGISEVEQYDYLDALLSGVMSRPQPGGDIAALAPEMVFYQPTPARHIFDLIHRLSLGADDVLLDLGAGLGHVPLLVAICSGARCIGVEWEAAYVASAQACAQTLQLANVSFMQQDVRVADLSQGTVFYLYTPFTGSMLRDVLDRLAQEAAKRAIRVCTLGPCTEVVAGENWLQQIGLPQGGRIAVFRSAPV